MIESNKNTHGMIITGLRPNLSESHPLSGLQAVDTAPCSSVRLNAAVAGRCSVSSAYVVR
jgi:hypothetical protein